ncbi:glycosyltransferase [Agromyces allii]|uniref:Glycosyltransferase n=1 Tax=Agromyces allii TaxID=393607 RepID=A0ABP5BI22_9MICO|nr:glycosyltransferase [Agromyces allii]
MAAAADGFELPYLRDPDRPERPSIEELCRELESFDVISFDLFGVVLQSTVETPADVFRVVGAKLGLMGFAEIRSAAEAQVRRSSDPDRVHATALLDEVYAELAARHGVAPAVRAVEEATVIELTRPNPDIRAVYDHLEAMGKRIVFTGNVALDPVNVGRLLERNGYGDRLDADLVSGPSAREHVRSAPETLLDLVAPDLRAAHVGEVSVSEAARLEPIGVHVVGYRTARSFVREADMDTLAGSFYGAVVENVMGAEAWNGNAHYAHGFRVGGILALGYSEFLERLARERRVDRILFCGRGSYLISQVYTRFNGSVESAYIGTSRTALLGITLGRHFGDYLNRTVFRWLADSDESRTIGQILSDTGFGYLLPHLEGADIERFLFPSGGAPSAIRRRLEKFLWDHRREIEEHNAQSRSAAKRMLEDAIGDAQRVLVVDLGWAGTTAQVIREFVHDEIGEDREVIGALLCSSRSRGTSDAIATGLLTAYLQSATHNMDLTRLLVPSGPHPAQLDDLQRYPIEYLFAEPEATVTGYGFDASGEPRALTGNNTPPNVDQIREMQRGVLDFAAAYTSSSAGFAVCRPISPYVAYSPMKNAMGRDRYRDAVYRDFAYDTGPALFAPTASPGRFGDLSGEAVGRAVAADRSLEPWPPRSHRDRILFVAADLADTDAARGLLRQCDLAVSLGYEPIVWTARTGALSRDFRAQGYPVSVVEPAELSDPTVAELSARGVRLVVCDSVTVDGFVRRFEGRLPLVWNVRATDDLPELLRSDPDRAAALRRSPNLCCTDDHAAAVISEYADGPVAVVGDSAVDRAAEPLHPVDRPAGVFRFALLGILEPRSGIDVAVAAFRSLPETYRQRAELHLAGTFTNRGTSFASFVFGRIQHEPNIRFHDLGSDERSRSAFLSDADVVVAAAADESCSSVIREAAMLARPLVATVESGAAGLVRPQNGTLVGLGDVEALRDAFIELIDADPSDLVEMGAASRERYAHHASREAHRRALGELFRQRITAGATGETAPRCDGHEPRSRAEQLVNAGAPVIVSLTSFPARIASIGACIDSLRAQTLEADAVILWLSVAQFPGREADLPRDLLGRRDDVFRIEWVDEDLGPHKKYFYAAQAHPDALIVTVDDDAVYGTRLLRNLVEGHLEQPHSIVCDRANLMLFRPDGTPREYDGWAYGVDHLRGTLTYQLLPTGVGGVLYPPGSLPPEAFVSSAILETSPYADDLWLKVMTSANGFPVWMPRERSGYQLIEETQSSALWKSNAIQRGNDEALARVLAYFDRAIEDRAALLRRILGVGPDGVFVEPRGSEVVPLVGLTSDRA